MCVLMWVSALLLGIYPIAHQNNKKIIIKKKIRKREKAHTPARHTRVKNA